MPRKERGGALVPRCALAAHTPEPTTGPRAARSNPCSIPALERVQLRPAATSCDQLRPAATARGQQQCHDFCSAERRGSLQMRFGWGTLRPARSTRLSGFPCWGTTAGVVLVEYARKCGSGRQRAVPFVASCSSLRRHGLQKQRSQQATIGVVRIRARRVIFGYRCQSCAPRTPQTAPLANPHCPIQLHDT